MNCATVEELVSDYLEGALSTEHHRAVGAHLQTCPACAILLAGITEVISAGRAFPVYEPPPWLAARIVANTPRITRESWTDTMTSVWKWIVEPRTAMALFTAVLVLGWMGSLAGISPDWATAVRHPAAIYYSAHGVLDHAYDGAIRKYYRSPLVAEIQARIDQIREIS
ncbi:MAG TPA: zf-HC2 domain-containing protein [Terriglobia bacterium]